MIASQVLRIRSWIYESATVHLAVIEDFYRGSRAVPLQTFTTRHSNRKLSTVMALSTTFTQCAKETTKFGKITQTKGHFAVQCYLMSPILVPIEIQLTAALLSIYLSVLRRVQNWDVTYAESLCLIYTSFALTQFIDRLNIRCISELNDDKNSSGDEIANVNFLRRYRTYVLQNTKKENLLRLNN